MLKSIIVKKSLQLIIILNILLSGFISCRLAPVEQLLVFKSDSLPDNLSVVITTAAPTILVLSITDNFNPQNLQPNPNTTTAADWRINGIAPKAVHHYSRAVDELAKKANTYAVETRYWVYIELKKPLINGWYYQVSGPYGTKTL